MSLERISRGATAPTWIPSANGLRAVVRASSSGHQHGPTPNTITPLAQMTGELRAERERALAWKILGAVAIAVAVATASIWLDFALVAASGVTRG